MIASIFFFLFFCLTACSVEFDCKFGEGVICLNLRYALKCGKVNTCLQLWQNAEVNSVTKDLNCSLCKINLQRQKYLYFDKKSDMSHVDIRDIQRRLNYNDGVVCSILGDCKNTTIKLPTLRFSNTPCEHCEIIINEVKKMIDDNQTIKAIGDYLKDEICNRLPYSAIDICEEMIRDYVEFIVDQISKRICPKLLCEVLGFCSNDLILTTAINKHKLPKFGDTCGLCKLIIEYIYVELQENATEEEVKRELELICDYLPESFSATCRSFVESYIDMLIKMLINRMPPDEVCKELGVCYAKPSGLAISCSERRSVSERCKNYDEAKKCNFLSQCLVNFLTDYSNGYINCDACMHFLHAHSNDSLREIDCNLYPNEAEVCHEMKQYSIFPSQVSHTMTCMTNGWCSSNVTTIVPSEMPLSGRNPCTWGPSYWCSSLKSSRMCGMSMHCLMHVWRKPQQAHRPNCSGDLQILCADHSHSLCGAKVVRTCTALNDICQDDLKKLCSSKLLTELCNLQDHCYNELLELI